MIQIFWKKLKTKFLKAAKSSRSVSTNKKKAKRFKLAGVASFTSGNLHIGMEKRISFHHKCTNFCLLVRDIIKIAQYFNFSDVIKCTIFLLNMKFGRYHYKEDTNFSYYCTDLLWSELNCWSLWTFRYLIFMVMVIFIFMVSSIGGK